MSSVNFAGRRDFISLFKNNSRTPLAIISCIALRFEPLTPSVRATTCLAKAAPSTVVRMIVIAVSWFSVITGAFSDSFETVTRSSSSISPPSSSSLSRADGCVVVTQILRFRKQHTAQNWRLLSMVLTPSWVCTPSL